MAVDSLVPVLLEESEGIVVTKVLKLDECVLAVVLHHRLHELINEVVILLARHTPVPAANVVHVLKTYLRKIPEIKWYLHSRPQGTFRCWCRHQG